MADPQQCARVQLDRQVAHWVSAAHRLNLDDLAAPEAWHRLERYLGVSLRTHLGGVIDRIRKEADVLAALRQVARSPTAMLQLRDQLRAFRGKYIRAETTLDFFADAINTRTNPKISGLLRACDTLAQRAMSAVLDPLGRPVPIVLTYLDKGLGASILKAGLRLWDGGEASPVAAIKIVRHNLLRPTALVHEAGHQVAHTVGWNEELAATLAAGLAPYGSALAGVWASWASEIAADAFAFVHTGYASVASLHDVLSGEPSQVLLYVAGDPHPTSYIRVLIGTQMCRHVYGEGPWDELTASWVALQPLRDADAGTRNLLEGSIRMLPQIASLTLDTPMRAFGGRSIRALVRPEQASPAALQEMSVRLGPALFTSMHWIWTECVRLMALTGLQMATTPAETAGILNLQEEAMLRLGGALQAA